MSGKQITFINNTYSEVSLFHVDPASGREIPEFVMIPGTTSAIRRDLTVGLEWRMRYVLDGAVVGTYLTTDADRQQYLVGGHRIQLRFINTSPATVDLFSVDPVSGRERKELYTGPGTEAQINTHAVPGTEWRVKDTQSGNVRDIYRTTAEPFQTFTIGPSPSVIPVIDSIIPTVETTLVVTTDVTITAPHLDTRPLSPNITPSSSTPVTVAGARDSIFNANSFDVAVINLEHAIRQAAGTKDSSELRAAVYAGLMHIARNQARSREEQAVMDWLALQVKRTRIETARLALAEYDRWSHDPWRYEPPDGYGFPAYILPVAQSPIWLTTTPNPPVLANKSLASYFAEIISNNGWSPLNNPLLTKGRGISSLENVVGFPVFGTVRAYEKLYGTDAGTTALAETTIRLRAQSFNLPPLGVAFGSPAGLQAIRSANLEQLAPFAHRNLRAFAVELKNRLTASNQGLPLDPEDDGIFITMIKNMSKASIRSRMSDILTGEILSSFVASFVLSSALQEIINESMMLDAKLKLRGQLADHLARQQAAPPPDLANLLYHDIRGEVALYGADYQPTDTAELERMMGSNEVYRAFLLSTIE